MAATWNWKLLTRNISATVDRSPGNMAWWRHWPNKLYSVTPYTTLTIIRIKQQKIIEQKLASVSVRCKTAAFKQPISTLYPQILSIEASFYIYGKPMTEKMWCLASSYFLIVQNGGRRHIKFSIFQIFNSQSGKDDQALSACQVSSKSVIPRPRYGDFSIFQENDSRHLRFL